jgi:acyl-CoA synthetase (AMP-forming)/AMP-acid ligase II
MLTHRNIAAASASIIEYLENREDDVVVDFLPLYFDYGLYNVLMPFRFGGRVVLERSFLYLYQLVGLLKKERVTGLPIVPTIAAGLVKLRSLEGYDLPDLRYITSTGQPLPPPHIERLREIFPAEPRKIHAPPPRRDPRRAPPHGDRQDRAAGAESPDLAGLQGEETGWSHRPPWDPADWRPGRSSRAFIRGRSTWAVWH